MSADLVIEECPPEWGTEPASPEINPVHIFKSCVCGCGRVKRSGGPLCGVCWLKAPADLRRDVWKRDHLPTQIAALTEVRRMLGHTHEPVRPHYTPRFPVTDPVVEKAQIHTAQAITEAAAEEVPMPELPELQSPPAEWTQLQTPPSLPQRYIVRLTEAQMDRFLTAASADWKQRMVQSLLDEEEGL